MDYFETLFGLKPEEIKKTCIITPFLVKDLLKDFGISQLKKWKLYSCGNTENFTLIVTGIGPAFVGDAVLYLEETACKDIIFLGACGLVEKSQSLDIGGLVCPQKAFAYESFSQLVKGSLEPALVGYPTSDYLKEFLSCHTGKNILSVNCASMGSLKLEEQYEALLKENKIELLDMECAAFFHAAEHIKRRYLALLFITDILGEQPLFSYSQMTAEKKIFDSIREAVQLIKAFVS